MDDDTFYAPLSPISPLLLQQSHHQQQPPLSVPLQPPPLLRSLNTNERNNAMEKIMQIQKGLPVFVMSIVCFPLTDREKVEAVYLRVINDKIHRIDRCFDSVGTLISTTITLF
jgi:hypothetical protein